MHRSTADHDALEAAMRVRLKGRYDQAFPTFTNAEIERLRRYGDIRHYADGELLFTTGNPTPGISLVLVGHVAVSTRDGLGRIYPLVDQGVGQFLGELGALSDRSPALVDGHAEGVVETLLIEPERVRALLTAEAELGERIMRAMLLRRVGLIELDSGGPLLIGSPFSGDMVRLQGFLTRNGHPHHVLDPLNDSVAAEFIARYLPADKELPLVICPNGATLRNPGELALSRELGLIGNLANSTVYDVAIVGAGPAGLATAVYAASEGLSVAVLEAHAFGGQAGASARIENYLGFPTGISGQALAGRAFAQAHKFGANIMIPVQVVKLECHAAHDGFSLIIDDGNRLSARSVVIASGARYRRPAIENLSTFEGRGVHYWASPIEGTLCHGQDVILVGGGNSAGQAAVYLAGRAAKVRLMVRGPSLAASMSRYLIERIAAMPNIELMTRTEIIGVEGTPADGLQRVRWREGDPVKETTAAVRHVFIFVGADPATQWLGDCDVELDSNGFVVTGRQSSTLATTLPGVFAVGDVRSGSIKRVGSAIGEGAQVVAALHDFLEHPTQPTTNATGDSHE